MVGRLFQCFQQRIGGADRHAIRIVDQADFTIPDQWAIDHLMFDVANELNFDLRIGEFAIGLDHHEVGMGARLDLAAGSADAAGIRGLLVRQSFAQECLRQAKGQEAFADAIIAVEEIGMGQTILDDRGSKQRLGAVMSDDVSEGHGEPAIFGVKGSLAPPCCCLRGGGLCRASGRRLGRLRGRRFLSRCVRIPL